MFYYRKLSQSSTKKEARQWLRFILGIFVLSIGSLVYLIDRPANKSYLIPESISLFDKTLSLFGEIGNHLPTFSHAFAFVLITAALSSARRSSYLLFCGTWLLIDCLFELGQHEFFSERIISSVPDFFIDVPFLSHALNYFQNGRYDPIDMASIILGVIAAYIVLLATEKRHRQPPSSA